MFLTKGNVETIWDVLQDEKLPNMNEQVFINNIKLFGEKERSSGLTLYQMNTKFIMQFKDFMEKQHLQQRVLKQQQQQEHQYQQQQQHQHHHQNTNKQTDGPIRLNIQDSESNYSITAEELHAERIGEFEKQLSQKQNEFSSLMIQEKPADLNFSDVKDSPIGSEMEQLIANTMKQRNFDIEQIHSQNTSINATTTTNWLSSKDTSLKTEKNIEKSNNDNKHISWSNELTSEEPPILIESIFSKLKQVKNVTDTKGVKENELTEINNKLDKIIKHFNII
jgi:hypothetical protein